MDQNNDNYQNTNSNNDQNRDRDKKSNVGKYLPLVILALLAGFYFMSKANKDKEDQIPTLNNGVVSTQQNETKKGVNLTPEERKAQEERATEAENTIKGFTATSTTEDRYNAYIKLAGAKYRLGEHTASIAALDKIRDENPNKARIWTQYTLTYNDMGETDKARESLKKALELDATNPQHLLLNIQLNPDQSKEALDKMYVEALQKSDNYIDVVIAYAQFQEKNGDKVKAVEYWNKAKTINASGAAQYDAEISRLQK